MLKKNLKHNVSLYFQNKITLKYERGNKDMKDNSSRILRAINQYSNMKRKYEKIKNDEQRRTNNASFAISSMIYSLLAICTGIVGAWLITLSFESILFIFTLVIGIIFLFGTIGLLILSIIALVFQFKLNKKGWSWISLILFFVAIGSILFGILYFFNH